MQSFESFFNFTEDTSFYPAKDVSTYFPSTIHYALSPWRAVSAFPALLPLLIRRSKYHGILCSIVRTDGDQVCLEERRRRAAEIAQSHHTQRLSHRESDYHMSHKIELAR